uniref:Reverse transcriptase zinc-binding domain-containing protein n=1 Tax=Arundo donax TaxID=35708 RepID=A0A0A9B169_ARUDO
MSFFKFPKWALDLINSHMANCLWDDYEGHSKIHLANWHLVCMKKEYGGLGVPNLRDLNLCLLGSWIKRFISDEGKLWHLLIDRKYVKSQNIFALHHSHKSTFWKGVLWATQALKFGYRWMVGNGKKVRFWEDTWFGTAPLAVLFWDLYSIVNEKGKAISEIWVENELRVSFRRTFSTDMWQRWLELVEISSSIQLNDEMDSMIWQYEPSGVYSTQSLYVVINFRDVTPVYIPAVWNLNILPRVQVFIWLLSNNKLMTKDNLKIRGVEKPPHCMFCEEIETIPHLFFDCIVAKSCWEMTSDFLGSKIGQDYESIACKWLSSKKFGATNTISAIVLWSIWLIRNNFIFRKQSWKDIRYVWWTILKISRNWKPLYKESISTKMEQWQTYVEQQARAPLRIK